MANSTSKPIDRRDFGRMVVGGMAGALAASCATQTGGSQRMPVVFVGHGSPMNVLRDNEWSRGFKALGKSLPRPRTILAISAHWYVDGTFLTSHQDPRMMHDFGGFPPELYNKLYPAPGKPELARRAAGLVKGAGLKPEWGLDHGTWTVLYHSYPRADIPVVQLSIDRRLSPQQYNDLGRQLRDLRNEGVLIFCSGNITHNVRHRGDAMNAGYAQRFDAAVAEALIQHDSKRLVGLADTDDGKLSHPTPDHWVPLLYAQGAADERDRVAFPIEGFAGGALSMRAVRFG